MTEIFLYPDAAPDTEMPPETTFTPPGGPGGTGGPGTTMVRNVSRPSLTVVLPKPGQGHGGAAIIAPGGGWRILAWEHEGTDLAQRLADLGYACFVLKYRLNATPVDEVEFMKSFGPPAGGDPFAKKKNAELPRAIAELAPGTRAKAARDRAADDGRAALALVRGRAAEWGVDPARIGMVGFSAGAFLTADVAREPGQGAAPLAWAAPIYGGETGGQAVPADAPPLFVAVAGDDRMLVRVCEGLYGDWIDADRPAELHVFRRGGHGFGVSKLNSPSDAWLGLFERWLTEVGL